MKETNKKLRYGPTEQGCYLFGESFLAPKTPSDNTYLVTICCEQNTMPGLRQNEEVLDTPCQVGSLTTEKTTVQGLTRKKQDRR